MSEALELANRIYAREPKGLGREITLAREILRLNLIISDSIRHCQSLGYSYSAIFIREMLDDYDFPMPEIRP